MFNKKLYITIITIISILILSISCGNSMTNSTNGGNVENNGGSISGGGETNSRGNISGGGTSRGDGKTHKNYSLLIGTWQGQDPKNPQEAYRYDGTNFYADPGPTYSIEVLEISWTTDTEGFFYGKYLTSWDDKSIGKYYAISFKGLTETDLKISGALNGTHGVSQSGWTADTLEEAKKIFTIAAGSFAQYTDCKKK